ncbi:MAG TPA: hypothetical protein VL485_22120 [Ktedonobacteraceae bacterium]|nr:hypothetical protein [Ktedonobacteraceae bacterium]
MPLISLKPDPIHRGDAVAVEYYIRQQGPGVRRVHNGVALETLNPGPPTDGGAVIAHVATYLHIGRRCVHHRRPVPRPNDWVLIRVLQYRTKASFSIPDSAGITPLDKVRNISGALTNPGAHAVHIRWPIAFELNGNASDPHNGAFVAFQLFNKNTNTVRNTTYSVTRAMNLARQTVLHPSLYQGILYYAHYANRNRARTPGPFFYQGEIMVGKIRLAWLHGSMLPATIPCP